MRKGISAVVNRKRPAIEREELKVGIEEYMSAVKTRHARSRAIRNERTFIRHVKIEFQLFPSGWRVNNDLHSAVIEAPFRQVIRVKRLSFADTFGLQ